MDVASAESRPGQAEPGGAEQQVDAVVARTLPVTGGSGDQATTTRPLLAACGAVCYVPRDFFEQCDHLVQLTEDVEECDEEPICVRASAEDIATVLLLAEELPRAGSPAETWTIDQAAVAFRVASFVGHRDLLQRGLGVLTDAIVRAESLDKLIGDADRLPASLQAAVADVLGGCDAPPTVAAIGEVVAAVAAYNADMAAAEPEPEPAEEPSENPALQLEQFDSDMIFALLAGLDVSTCLRLVQCSYTTCSLVFASDFKFAFRAWSAVLQQPALSDGDLQSMTVYQAVAPAIDELNEDATATADANFAAPLTELIQLVIELQAHIGHLKVNQASGDGLAQLPWLEDQAMKLGGSDARRMLVARALVPQLAFIAQQLCCRRSPHDCGEQIYAIAKRAIDATAAAAGDLARAELVATTTSDAPTAKQKQRLDALWTRCEGAHYLQRAVFGYLEQHYIKREGLKPLQEMCTDARSPTWDAWTRRGWSPPVFSAPDAPDRSIRLVSADNEVFSVRMAVAKQSNTVKKIIDGWMATGGIPGADNCIPVPSIESPILSKVIEYCSWHVMAEQDRTADDVKNEWNQRFVDVDQGTLFHLILAANALDIPSLSDLTCKTVADMIKSKTPEEIRAHFNIQSEFTPEEEEEVRRENAWCEDI